MNRLRVDCVSKYIKKTRIIENISLEIESKQVVGLLGPNGAGKTTTFYIICGLISATSGNIFLDDENISTKPLHERAKIGIGYLPQESSIFKDLSVEDNLLIATEVSIKEEKDRKRRIEELLELFNIEPIRKRLGIHLSGGERRRVEIARALVNKPKFLLLDEPFAGVDPINVGDIQKIIKQLTELDIGVLITDHNVRETLNVCDKVAVIKDGNILAVGESSNILEHEGVKRYYLGENFKI
ncbi:MAG: LPS export ABC transporter ATP-binding protein [Campylobacterales bacterium]|nr:LPS export ABC transporter ATP-binding protein [Campylobacterales bacterium]